MPTINRLMLALRVLIIKYLTITTQSKAENAYNILFLERI